MRKRLVILLPLLILFSFNLAFSQEANKRPQTIGFVQGGATPDSLVDAFRQGLRDLGYIEGRNLAKGSNCLPFYRTSRTPLIDVDGDLLWFRFLGFWYVDF